MDQPPLEFDFPIGGNRVAARRGFEPELAVRPERRALLTTIWQKRPPYHLRLGGCCADRRGNCYVDINREL